VWTNDEIALLSAAAACVHLLGVATAVHGVLHARTSQAAAAWAIALVSFPYLALPLYWVFGRSKFFGYVHARRVQRADVADELRLLDHKWDKFPPTLTETGVRMRMLERLASSPWTGENRAELLIDSEATFDAIFETIDQARDYLVVQYYILRDDGIGGRFCDRLVAAARRGVRVFVLYDEFGCRPEPRRMFEALRGAGVRLAGFRPQKGGLRNFFRLNFRNPRKVVLADGRVACIGGLNVGDEYCGKSPRFGPWRDTHLRLRGPCVEAIQLAWIEDWHWAEGRLPELRWEPKGAPDSDQAALILPTGPADPLESCDLMFVTALQQAQRRVWIASPYFIPDPQTKASMQLAALRGVDVRFLIPDRADHWLVWHAAWSFFPAAQRAGVRIFRYREGFLHQKAILVDDDFAAVGTANFDNRSFRLNFEMMALIADEAFAGEVRAMLERDFAHADEMQPFELDEAPFLFRLKVRWANLFSQVL
jgi:cardiolipin synthase